MDANALAHEIHRRKKSMDANAPRHAAAGIARFCSDLGYEPTTDDFDPYLNLCLTNDDESLGLVTSDSSIWEIPDTRVHDFYVFARGERLAQVEIVGWLPELRVLSAPQVKMSRSRLAAVSFLVDTKCIYPMSASLNLTSKHFGLEEPDLDVPGLWNYDLHALWTPLGFHVYDHKIAQMVAQTDSEMSR